MDHVTDGGYSYPTRPLQPDPVAVDAAIRARARMRTFAARMANEDTSTIPPATRSQLYRLLRHARAAAAGLPPRQPKPTPPLHPDDLEHLRRLGDDAILDAAAQIDALFDAIDAVLANANFPQH